jgi:hypothetical protein
MKMKDRCHCGGWKNNIDIVNAPYSMHLSAVGEYKGKAFDFCPWCGDKLMDDKVEKGTALYSIPVDWQACGEVVVRAESLDKAINIIEGGVRRGDEIPFPTKHENVESSMEVNYQMAEEMYPDEEISAEPPCKTNGLDCPECGGLMGRHSIGCSIY